jgi:hypothetical protein
VSGSPQAASAAWIRGAALVAGLAVAGKLASHAVGVQLLGYAHRPVSPVMLAILFGIALGAALVVGGVAIVALAMTR